jgi:hypothetical protein
MKTSLSRFVVFILVVTLVIQCLITLAYAENPPAEPPVTSSWRVSQSSDDCIVYEASKDHSSWQSLANHVSFVAGYEPQYYRLYFGSAARFTGVTVGQGWTINDAYLVFTANDNRIGTGANTRLTGESVDNSATFSTIANYNSRPRTQASVDWDNIPAWSSQSTYESANITSIIQEIVNRPGWVSGNSLTIFWEDDQTSTNGRGAYSYDGSHSKAPMLVITYTESAAPVEEDYMAPSFYDVTANTTRRGQPCLFSAEWSDNVGLSGYIFGSNNSGSWKNETWVSWNPSEKQGGSIEVKILNGIFGQRVEWQIWANDTSNNWNTTGLRYFTTTEIPYDLGTCSNDWTALTAHMKKTFYGYGRFWVFYSDGTNVVFRSSVDGSSWSSPTFVRAGKYDFNLAVYFDGTYVHYVWSQWETSNVPMTCRRGKPQSDGSILWSDKEQIVALAGVGVKYKYAMITVDSDGHEWIGYRIESGNTAAPYVIKNDFTDGTWQTASGFPYKLCEGGSSELDFVVKVQPLTSGKMYVVYGEQYDVVKGKLWDGFSWGSEESVTRSNMGMYQYIDTVNINDDVHFVFRNESSHTILYYKRTYGVGWGEETVIQGPVPERSIVQIFVDRENSNTLYCFWSGGPDPQYVYYKKCVNGVWDSDPTSFVQLHEGIVDYDRISVFQEDYGSGGIGLIFAAAPSYGGYPIKYVFLPIAA